MKVRVLTLFIAYAIAVIAFAVFILGVVLTGYVSLGSVLACISFPITTAFVFPNQTYALIFSAATAVLAIAAHHGNIRRLIRGEERRFRFRKSTEKGK